MKKLLALTIRSMIPLALILGGIYLVHLRILKNFEPIYWKDYLEAWGVVLVLFLVSSATLTAVALLVRWILEKLKDKEVENP